MLKEKLMGQVEFRCSLSGPPSPLPHFWEHTIGSGHAALALRADWQAQLRRCHDELGFRYVRFHGLLSEHMGTLVGHNEGLLYSFFNVDQVTDFILSIGMKPFVELSFMPKAIASGGTTVFNYEANVTPPRHPEEWGALVSRLVTHWIDRHGADEVRQWFFEVWNEPNQKNSGPARKANTSSFIGIRPRRSRQSMRSFGLAAQRRRRMHGSVSFSNSAKRSAFGHGAADQSRAAAP